MRTRLILTATVFAAAVCLATGCPNRTENPDRPGAGMATGKSNLVIAVSYPLAYVCTRLLDGTEVRVDFPGKDAKNPGNWHPTEDAVAQMQTADAIIANRPGVIYAQWLTRVTLPESRICDSAAGLPTADFITVRDHRIVHRHGSEGEHSHPYNVPYSWLDPAVAARQALAIEERLVKTYPDLKAKIEANAKTLQKDLATLSQRIEAVTQSGAGDVAPAIWTANPNIKFLTRASGLTDAHLLWMEEVPDNAAGQIEQRLELLKSRENDPVDPAALLQKDGDSLMLWPDALGPPPAISGFRILEINMLDHPPGEGDYLTVMSENISILESLIDGE